MRVLSGAATALTCVGAAVSLAAASASAAGPEPHVLGPSFVYDDTYAEVLTKVVVHGTDDSTGVTLEASNFPRSAYGRTFGAHVHVNRCGPRPTDAGKHYQDRREGPLRDRELWLDFTVDQAGRARVHAERPWAVRPGAANSVVVHSRPTDKKGNAGDPILCTTVPFRGTGHHAADAKDAPKERGKHDKPVKTKKKVKEKADGKRVDPKKTKKKADVKSHEETPLYAWQSSPEPKTEEHRGHHDGRDHDRHGHHDGRDHDERDGRDHDKHGDHDRRGQHDGRDRDRHDGRDHDERGDRDRRDREERGHHDGRGHQAYRPGHPDGRWGARYPFGQWKPLYFTTHRPYDQRS